MTRLVTWSDAGASAGENSPTNEMEEVEEGEKQSGATVCGTFPLDGLPPVAHSGAESAEKSAT